jgi:sucrose-phosphate synthase
MMSENKLGLYIALLSLHGRVRAKDWELGIDADSGGQIVYVMEVAKALAEQEQVAQVDVFTRRFCGEGIAEDYNQPFESFHEKGRICRIAFGPESYLRKELLWPHLDEAVKAILAFIRQQGRVPDLLHSHYADAGYVATRLSRLLSRPMMHTGHSLGRVKRERLLAAGRKAASIDREFRFDRRIAAEEETLIHANFIVASTRQEAREQYGLYSYQAAAKVEVIPPGVDVAKFFAANSRSLAPFPLWKDCQRFLHDAEKPAILAIARADERKNILNLLHAYARHPDLVKLANLILILGNREDIYHLEPGARKIFSHLLYWQDRYDLYGHLALPKKHLSEDIPKIYQQVAALEGVFANVAYTEPFGLTLLEAAASGLPVVATNDGGPADIIDNCRNGFLVDPLDNQAIGEALFSALSDRPRYKRWQRSGLAGIKRHYTWEAHVRRYLKVFAERQAKKNRRSAETFSSRLPLARYLLIVDIDNTLIGGKGLAVLGAWLDSKQGQVAFAVATGRHLKSAAAAIAEHQAPLPEIWVTSVGTEIHYYQDPWVGDSEWHDLLHKDWDAEKAQAALENIPGLYRQEDEFQNRFKCSFYVSDIKAFRQKEVEKRLRAVKIKANVIFSHQRYLDILPIYASKGHAVAFLARKWGIPTKNILVAGDSGNDAAMIIGESHGVVVGNHSPEMAVLRGRPGVYFAKAGFAEGILEGIDHYQFAKDV